MVGGVRKVNTPPLRDGAKYSPLLVVVFVIGALCVISSPVAAQTPSPEHVTTCSNGTVVPDTTETGLINDCAWLLQEQHDLEGTGMLNWSGSIAITSWTGVTVENVVDTSVNPPTFSKHITWLVLSSQGLMGTIPAGLGNLTNLEALYLASNQLTGTIPLELGNLSTLKRLILNHNRLTGTIPEELGNLSGLQLLDLSNNQLTGAIPTQLGDLSALTVLQLQENMLSGSIPAQLGSLSNLGSLYLERNGLTGSIPTQLGSLSNLTLLNLHENLFSGSIPSALGSLSNMMWLNLRENQLTGSIPAQLGSLSKLKGLYLQNQKNEDDEYGLTGTIPTELGNLVDLQQLFLNGNKLSGSIPSQLGSLSNLEVLYLHDNMLNGIIPSQLGRLAKLRDLELNDNMLSGSIPSQVGSLANLTHLYLHRNQLSGSIPSQLGSLSKLDWLYLHENQLTGAIPSELGSLSTLTILALSTNNLSGAIPEELGNLSRLTAVALAENPLLSGCIPAGLRRVPTNDLADVDLPYCDVRLIRLSISPGTLTPTFDADVTGYTAAVGVGATQVTVTPANAHGATIQFLDTNDNVIADADSVMPGQQINLAADPTVIKVKVISVDRLAEHFYTVEVTRLNAAPAFPASETGDRGVAENTTGIVNVGAPVAAVDGDGDPLTYSISGADAASFDVGGSSGQLLTKAGETYDHEIKDSYSFTLSVHDGKDAAGNASTSIDATITVTVTITDVNEPPIVTSGPTSVNNYVENGTTSVGTYSADDPENGTITWSLAGADAGKFDISPGGALTFKTPPDYETPTDTGGINEYLVTVVASDGTNSDTRAVTITVTNVDEPPVVSGPTSVNNFAENGTGEAARYSAADPENDAITWSAGGADAGQFDLSPGGVLTFKAPPDYEAPTDTGRNNDYQVTVVATAEGKTGTRVVTVTVTDENERPVVSGPTSVNSYTENGAADVGTYSADDPENATITWSLAGADSGQFDLSTSGVLTFKAPPNYEAPTDTGGNNEYQVTVVASDGPNAVGHAVTVTVENIEEPGTVSLSSPQPRVGTALTATLTDPDGNITGLSWTWERSQNRSSWSPISGAATRHYTPAGGDLSHYLRVPASYTDGHGAGKGAQETSDHAVQPAPIMNNAPQFSSGTADREIAEGSAEGTPVGEPVTATDQDGDLLTYTLTAGDGDSFAIVDGTGQVRVGPNTQLDHETRDSYSVTVTATDPSNASDSIVVTITVTDVNEPPVALSDTAGTDEDTAIVIPVLTNDDDPEGQPLTVSSLTRPDNGTATVEADHTITYTPRPDFHGTDTFTYRASDGVRDSAAAATVRVTVHPVNDPPAFPPGPAERLVAPQAAAGTPVGAPVVASDRDSDTLEYHLTGSDARFFEIDQYNGQITVGTGTVLDPEVQPSYAVTVTARDPRGAATNITVTITVKSAPPPPPPPPPPRGPSGPPAPSGPPTPATPSTPQGVIGATSAATATELPGDRLRIQRHDLPDASLEVAIGSITADCATTVMAGVIRDETLGQTYIVVRREADGQIVRRWVPPYSPLVYQIPWAVVNTQYTVPVGVAGAIPMDDQCPQPSLLVRRFDGGDDRIFAYHAAPQQWRHVPDIATFQALGFYWCNVTAADAAFFARITPGPPYPASQTPARGDYPNCLTS